MIHNKKSFRSLIAFLVTWAFVVLTVSGIVLYIVPQGRIAYWTHWSLAGLDKEQWGWVHMMFGGIFIITGALHLYFNWKPFKQYLAKRIEGSWNLSWELVISLLFTVLVVVLSINNLPPASWVFALNDAIKSSWVTSSELEPPFGHAEEISLKGILKRMQLSQEAALASLKKHHVRFQLSDSLDTIARNNNTTPMVIYGYISQHEKTAKRSRSKPWTAEAIEARFSGTGLGRKSLAELCDAAGIELDTCLTRLEAGAVSAGAEDNVRAVAVAHGLNPIDLLKLVLMPVQ